MIFDCLLPLVNGRDSRLEIVVRRVGQLRTGQLLKHPVHNSGEVLAAGRRPVRFGKPGGKNVLQERLILFGQCRGRRRLGVEHFNDQPVESGSWRRAIGEIDFLQRDVTVAIINDFDIGPLADPFAHVLFVPMRPRAAGFELQAAVNRSLDNLQAVDDQPHGTAGAVQAVEDSGLFNFESWRTQNAAQLE